MALEGAVHLVEAPMHPLARLFVERDLAPELKSRSPNAGELLRSLSH